MSGPDRRAREVAINTAAGVGVEPGRGAPADARRLYRRRNGRLLGGVAAGIAEHVGVRVLAVRVAFVVLLGFNGLGALLYAVYWAVLPAAPEERRSVPGRFVRVLGFVALAIGVLIARSLISDDRTTAALGWLFALIAVGAGIIWHQTGGLDRRRGGEPVAGGVSGTPATPWLGAMLTETGRRAYLLRFIGGGTLIVIGTIGLAALFAPVGGASVAAVINGLLFALLALTGVGLVAAPVLWRMFGVLREEREARIREQERAEFAAMVHDQVLHTLALIQRTATAGSTVYRLARAQERTLRNWLYKPTGSPTEKLAAALEEVAGEVEDAYVITVEVVVVGDADTNDRIRALVAAAREALVNAARHAGVATVSLYAEVEVDKVSVFVRDRGIGFDPAAVEPSRHGVRGSIIGRMERHGGRAEIISTPGEGTEVRLTMPVLAHRPERAERDRVERAERVARVEPVAPADRTDGVDGAVERGRSAGVDGPDTVAGTGIGAGTGASARPAGSADSAGGAAPAGDMDAVRDADPAGGTAPAGDVDAAGDADPAGGADRVDEVDPAGRADPAGRKDGPV